MITTPTTFVVGAGASKVYKLPTAFQLWEEAYALNPNYPAYKLILAAEICTRDQLGYIFEDLRNHGTMSIDEFLFTRQDDPLTMKVGRALIAVLLVNHFHEVRSPELLGGEATDWLGYIIYKMQSGAPDCDAFVNGNTEVRFVTFNFDSVIEDRLEKAIRNLYRGTSEKCLVKAIEAMHCQIIHVHGRLKPPPARRLTFDQFHYPQDWVHWLQSAPSKIHLVMDDIDPDILAVAQEAVKRSEILCFLGFAYANDNLEKLDLPKARNLGLDGQYATRWIYGTAFGMRPGEKEPVTNKLTGAVPAVLGGESEGCRDFLRNHHIFRG